ncbi:MAG: Ferrous-iron efflux pump FieF [Syntrophorhabdus sp. PtaB.Bin006]|nr:MAG: Ferrous-iron efflux pump FieF [Syntrophorhabdus sp. PtaB.Bin006]
MDIRQKASLFAISAATVLAGSKFLAGGVSGSMAVTSSGLDSLLDVFMSGINFLAIKKAAEPADDVHQYGHYKIEDLAAVGQSLVIIFSGSTIIYKAVRKFLGSEAIAYTGLDLGVMLLSLVFSVLISRVLTNVARRTDSKPLRADALHYTSDLYSNFGAIAAICLSYYTGKVFFDLLFAVIVGVIILLSAGRILWEGFSGLMDARIPEDMEKEIERVIDVMPYPYAGYHKLRTRISGSKWYADFHLLACRRASIDEAHDLSQKVELELNRMHRSLDVTIHIEPCPGECELTDETCLVRRGKPFRFLPA